MTSNISEINKVIWIDKSVYNDENQGYKKIMEDKYGLEVNTFDNAKLGIEAIKETETYSPIFIITSGSIYPEFYQFFKRAVTYIKNLPVQIIFTSSVQGFKANHKNDEIGQQIGKFYNLGGVTDIFSDVENFIVKMNTKLKNYKVNCPYTYSRSQDFTGLQTFSYISESKTLSLPMFYKSILINSKIDYKETLAFIHFVLNNFGNKKIAELFKGMILFNDIPDPILSKFFARGYTLESPFYGIMNQNLMKKNYNYFSTYIKFLYKGIINNSYQPKTDCTLYRGTKLESFEINYLKNILKKKKLNHEIPIIYCTSFLSFSTNYTTAENLAERREIDPHKDKEMSIIVDDSMVETDESSENNNMKQYQIKIMQPENKVKINKINLKIQPLKNKNKSINKYKPLAKNVVPKKNAHKSIGKMNILIKKEPIINIVKESSSLNNEVILKLNPLKKRDKDKVMITNGFLNQISYFHEEDEVLFFPFSSFELVDVYEDETRTFIELDYSTRFLKKVEKCIYFK